MQSNKTNSQSRVPSLQEAPKTSISQSAQRAIEAAIHTILVQIGEDPTREGLLETPNRIARMYQELTQGYRADPEALINDALFNVDYHDMVMVKDIQFYSLCEHHMLPFFGQAHVAYVPTGQVIGLSKIPRIVEMFAQRLQIQERLTNQIADFMENTLKPEGVAVVVEGKHMCTTMRGVRNEEAVMVTSASRGSFKTDTILRAEFRDHLNRQVNL